LTEKYDAADAIDAALKDHPRERRLFEWLRKVWNTTDDRCYEEFDPDRPYGDDYAQ